MLNNIQSNNPEIQKITVQAHIVQNIHDTELIKEFKIYYTDQHYYLINALLDLKKYQEALNVFKRIEQIFKSRFKNSNTQNYADKGLFRIRKNDSYYFHLFKTYYLFEKYSDALDAAKMIVNKCLKEYCTFKSQGKEYEPLVCEYNKFLFAEYVSKFETEELFVKHIEDKISEEWIDSLNEIDKRDFYLRTGHIKLACEYFEKSSIKEAHFLTKLYKNKEYNDKLDIILEEKETKIEKRSIIFPTKFFNKIKCVKIQAVDPKKVESGEIFLMDEACLLAKEKFLKWHRKVLQETGYLDTDSSS